MARLRPLEVPHPPRVWVDRAIVTIDSSATHQNLFWWKSEDEANTGTFESNNTRA